MRQNTYTSLTVSHNRDKVDRRTKVIADKKIHNKSGTVKMKCKL